MGRYLKIFVFFSRSEPGRVATMSMGLQSPSVLGVFALLRQLI